MASPLSPIPPPTFLSATSVATTLSRRSLLLSSTLSTTLTTTPLLSSSSLSPPPLDTTITDRVFLDFSLCPTYFRNTTSAVSDSADTTPLCPDPTSLGRLVLGLYGNLLPLTVSTFKLMCTSSSYKNTLVHKIFPGQFFQAGRQGRIREYGEVSLPTDLDLPRNTETVDSKAFLLKHSKAGVVSLCLSENDDDDDVELDVDYRNVEFLITTGPGPCPQLDKNNIVFGTVLQGMDVVTAIAAIPTYKPSERIQQFNDLAEFFGDERAQKGRTLWNRPLKTVYISDCDVSPGEGTGATMSDNEDEVVDSDTSMFDGSFDGIDSMGFGPLVPTETERSLMQHVRQELKHEIYIRLKSKRKR